MSLMIHLDVSEGKESKVNPSKTPIFKVRVYKGFRVQCICKVGLVSVPWNDRVAGAEEEYPTEVEG